MCLGFVSPCALWSFISLNFNFVENHFTWILNDRKNLKSPHCVPNNIISITAIYLVVYVEFCGGIFLERALFILFSNFTFVCYPHSVVVRQLIGTDFCNPAIKLLEFVDNGAGSRYDKNQSPEDIFLPLLQNGTTIWNFFNT